MVYQETVVEFSGDHDWRSGYALASHLCDPGSIPVLGISCGLSFVVGLVFSNSLVLLPPQKPSLLNSNLIWKSGPPMRTVLETEGVTLLENIDY